MYKILLENATFRELNIPISPEKRMEMDRKIRKSEPVDPIITWNSYVLKGYEQHDLSRKYHRNIPIQIMYFARKTEAIAWLCREQMKRTDLTWTGRAWLISRLYDALLEISRQQIAKENFQYRQITPSPSTEKREKAAHENRLLLEELGQKYNCHRDTIRRYVQFGRRLDMLEEKIPGIRNRILTGGLNVMMAHMPALLKMPLEQLESMADNGDIRRLRPPAELYNIPQRNRKHRKKKSIQVKTGIKQMPEYDPDADLNGLRYTIGAWRKAINRTKNQADFGRATAAGKVRLKQELDKLMSETESLCKILEEQPDD